MKKHLLLALFFIAPLWATESDLSSSEQVAHEHTVDISSGDERGEDGVEENVYDTLYRVSTIQEEQPPGMGPCAWFGVQPCPTICCGMCAAIWITVFYFKTHGALKDF